MVFSPRVIRGIWHVLREEYVFVKNPDAPAVETFLAHYAVPGADPTFSWPDKGQGLTWSYDVTINQVQVEPFHYPCSWHANDANRALWKFLPPRLLEEPVDWTRRWVEATDAVDLAAMRFIREQGFDWRTVVPATDWERIWFTHPYQPDQVDARTMEFVLEQGFDLHNFLRPADWTKTWFMAAGVCDVEAMRLLLKQGFDVNTVDGRGRSALWYAAGYYGGRVVAVRFLVEAGIRVGPVDELIRLGEESVTCASEASEQREVAEYLRRR
jgi:hypothetical protein